MISQASVNSSSARSGFSSFAIENEFFDFVVSFMALMDGAESTGAIFHKTSGESGLRIYSDDPRLRN